MSHRRISKTAGWALGKLPLGPHGRPLCRWCGKEVSGRRRTFCSDECVDHHKIRSDPSYVRTKVFERDAGVCSKCGANTEELRKRLRSATYEDMGRFARYNRTVQEAYCKMRGEVYGTTIIRLAEAVGIPEQFHGLSLARSWWEADHIVPVVEGGGECGLEGYRTLCIPCHRQETRKLIGKLAAKRRNKSVAP